MLHNADSNDKIVIGDIVITGNIAALLCPPEELTEAEVLILLAQNLLAHPGRLTEVHGSLSAATLARFKVAIDFLRKTSPAFRFRAIIEGWDYTHIVRSLY